MHRKDFLRRVNLFLRAFDSSSAKPIILIFLIAFYVSGSTLLLKICRLLSTARQQTINAQLAVDFPPRPKYIVANPTFINANAAIKKVDDAH